MDSTNFLQLLQTGFRISLGATTSLVETLQDSAKREENLSQLRSELTQRVAEWAAKGEITEQEARTFIEAILKQQSNPGGSPATDTASQASTTPPTPSATADAQLKIEELTAQIAAMRRELEKLRNPSSNN